MKDRMKNIINIFIDDIKQIRKNSIALIVIVGLSIVPSLYAWFNISASWNPYENTGSLKVAVANSDKGYRGSVIPIDLNIGDKVVSSLRENEQLGWTFVDEKEAIEGVKSGKYYASIVIPDTFSQDMMSLFSKDIKKAEIKYYLNEKENAIAPKVTDKGAGAIEKQIDEIFAKTVSEIGLDVMDTISDISDKKDVKNIATNVSENTQKIADDLKDAEYTVQAFSDMALSLQNTMNTTSEFLGKTSENIESDRKTLKSIENNASNMESSAIKTADAIVNAVDKSNDCFKKVSDEIDSIFSSLDNGSSGSISQNIESAKKALSVLSDKVGKIITDYTNLKENLLNLESKIPGSEAYIEPIISQIDDAIEKQKNIQEKIDSINADMSQSVSDIEKYKKELKELSKSSSQSIDKIGQQYRNNLKSEFSSLGKNIDSINNSADLIFADLGKSATSMKNLSSDAAGDIGNLKKSLDDSVVLIKDAESKLNSISAKMKEAANSGDIETLRKILGSDPDEISAFLSAPVKMDTRKIYPVENYGSAMTPFYTTLSMWVGGIILVAMLKTGISDRLRKKLDNVKNHEIYLGRFLLFAAMGIIQSTIICMGDLFFLQIQCEHPLMFMFAGWFTSLVYVSIIYTLTVSFGDVGKAICVVLLVMQVAGSGGTFPIEMAPKVFQKVYPLLPFTQSMTAMRECIAGIYENTYWIALGKLSVFMILSFILGLVLRKPIIKLNEMFMEKLESTKIM